MNFSVILLVLAVIVAAVTIQAGSPPDAKWTSIDSSSDGKILLAVSSDEGVHVSNDGGLNWTKALIGCDSFTKGVVSGNGKYMLVGTYCKQTVGSSDYGQTWAAVDLPSEFSGFAVEMSETGQHQVAVSFIPTMIGQIHFSKDYGVSWNIATGYVSTLGSLAMSSVGDHIYVGPVSGSFMHSTDYGKSFKRTSFSTYQGGLLTCDANCEYMAYSNMNSLYLSNNNGTSFDKADLPQGSFSDAVFSADGKYMYAAMSGEGIYYSADYGRTWDKTGADNGFFVSIATDSTGRIVAGALNSGSIVVSNDYGKTWA